MIYALFRVWISHYGFVTSTWAVVADGRILGCVVMDGSQEHVDECLSEWTDIVDWINYNLNNPKHDPAMYKKIQNALENSDTDKGDSLELIVSYDEGPSRTFKFRFRSIEYYEDWLRLPDSRETKKQWTPSIQRVVEMMKLHELSES